MVRKSSAGGVARRPDDRPDFHDRSVAPRFARLSRPVIRRVQGGCKGPWDHQVARNKRFDCLDLRLPVTALAYHGSGDTVVGKPARRNCGGLAWTARAPLAPS